MGSRTPNPAEAILRARDKLLAHQVLAAHGIDMPVTVFGDSPDDTDDLLGHARPAAARDQADQRLAGRWRDVDRKIVRLAGRGRSPARAGMRIS
jgi:hypothetical protein